MLATLIWKELLDHLLSLRFTITCVLCFFVLLISFFVRSADYVQVLEDYHKAHGADKAQLDRAERPWHVLWHRIHVRRAPNPLKVFVRGVRSDNGDATFFRARTPLQLRRPDVRSSSSSLFPSIDLIVFVGLILSLMAILFGYDTICGEKEQGTLRLTLSYAIPRDRILAAKWIGGFAALVIPYLLALAGMVALIFIQSSIAFSPDQWGRLMLIVLLSILYLAVIFTMAMWVSCLTARPSTSIMILVTLWVILFLAVPNVAPHLARWAHPTAGVQEIEKQRNEDVKNIWERVVSVPRKEYDEQYGFAERWWSKIDWSVWKDNKEKARKRWLFRSQVRKEGTAQILRLYDKMQQQLNADLAAQVGITRWIARLSPFGCFAMAAAELAGEGPRIQRDFLDQVRVHHQAMQAFGWDEELWLIKELIKTEDKWPERWPATRQNPLPVFQYKPPLTTELLKAVSVEAGILAALVVVFFLLSTMSFLRYDVR
jgi:ABC-type transport system involved in multi-copper enzyme maturation permease subunit